MAQNVRRTLEAAVHAAFGTGTALREAKPVSGGCVHAAWRIRTNRASLFAKINGREFAETFSAEADGLVALEAAGMRVPRVLAQGVCGPDAYLVLEWLDLSPQGDDAALGQALARLHRNTGESHGWVRDNALGTTVQRNAQTTDWLTFWRDCRLAPLIEKTGSRDHRLHALLRGLLDALPDLLRGHAPAASLLHGDLWRGNVGFLHDGSPAVFDPAVYRGDRETDLAMTELFGGFPSAFARAYDTAWPRDPGYTRRRDLYNLYHLLNHLHLFGNGYLAQARACAAGLLGRSG